MKKLIITAVLIIFALSANADANTNFASRVGGYFYTSLSPYGTWIDIGFGTPVWRPTMIRRTWSPYTRGQWIYTDYGWYWDSYEDFGYITYHYGRWYYDDYYGWIWVPDYEWAPAWVEWRYDNNYIGWAPLSPYALFSINIGIHYTYNYQVPYYHWNFVKYNHFCDHNVYNYYVGSNYKSGIYKKTKMRTNYSYYDGRVRNNGVELNRIKERNGRNFEKRNIVGVSDPNKITKDRTLQTRDKEIRTYFANPSDMSREKVRDVKIERKDRKSSLDLSKVEIGREKTTERNVERTTGSREVEKRGTVNVERKNSTVDVRKQDVNTRKVNSNTNTRNVEQIKRNEEIKRQEDIRKSEEQKRINETKRNEQIKIQRKQSEETQKKNNSTVQQREVKKSTTNVRKQSTNTNVQRNSSQNSSNRNTVTRSGSSNTRTKTNSSSRNSDEKSKTRTR